MSGPALFRRTLTGFVPLNEEANRAFRRFKPGQVVELSDRQRRSLPWLSRYWVLCALIADNSRYSKEEVDDLLKLRCGCVRLIEERDGTVHRIPDSIAFTRMTADQWAEYWERVVAYVAADLLPGVTKRELERELSDLIGLTTANAGVAA